MNVSKKLSLVVVALATSSAAIFSMNAFAADDGGLPKPKPDAGPTKSRAEVKSDRAQAAKAGELNKSSHANLDGLETNVPSKKTRADVKGETAVAKKADGGTLKTPKN